MASAFGGQRSIQLSYECICAGGTIGRRPVMQAGQVMMACGPDWFEDGLSALS